ncbi:MAG TPA: transcriptional regulator [Cytophagales bacterium]|jgi:nitrogen regulatory protein PII|nr:transcriptional regulator [Cytophagales bacterium]
MKPLKKIEIIAGAIESKKVEKILKEHQITDYSVITGVRGRGGRGDRDGDGLTDAFQNRMLIVACPEEDFEKFKEPLRNFLKKAGGICLVSDVMWLNH